jgi:hypothetical protein
MDFISAGSEAASVIEYFTLNITGSVFLSLLFIMIALLVIALALRIPIEYTAILVFPLILGFAAYYSAFLPAVGICILYLAVLAANNWLFNR